jgi:hypothetical protein
VPSAPTTNIPVHSVDAVDGCDVVEHRRLDRPSVAAGEVEVSCAALCGTHNNVGGRLGEDLLEGLVDGVGEDV